MKCPLLVRIRQPDPSHKTVYPANCIRDKCAFWSIEMKEYDPTGLLPWLKHIEGHLAKLAGEHAHNVKIEG